MRFSHIKTKFVLNNSFFAEQINGKFGLKLPTNVK